MATIVRYFKIESFGRSIDSAPKTKTLITSKVICTSKNKKHS